MTRKFDHTALRDLQCEEEFARRHRDGLRAPPRDASLVIGKAIHAGIQAYYYGADAGTCASATSAAWAGFDAGEDFRTLPMALAIVALYQEIYPPASWGFDVLYNEGYYEGDDVTGIPDRIVRRHLDSQVYPLELKTSSLWLGGPWQEQWGFSAQAAIQMDLAQQAVGETPAGFWLDGIYLSRRAAGPIADDFIRAGPFGYSLALREEMRERRRLRSARALEIIERRGPKPEMNEAQCFRYNRLCPFFRFCRADPQDREEMYELALATGELERHFWDPSKRD